MISKENLEDYFVFVASCHYAKAKRVMENILLSNKNDSKSNLCKLVNGFLLVLSLEKNYYSLQFFNIKKKSLFYKKEVQHESYGDLLEKVKHITIDNTNDNGHSEIINAAKSSLSLFCEIRLRMIEMYSEIAQLGQNDNRSILDLIYLVRPLKDYLKHLISVSKDWNLSLITPLLLVIEMEIDILVNLAEAQQLIGNLYFLVPINLLHSANVKCQTFMETCSGLRSSSVLFSRHSQSLPLHSWFIELYNKCLAKYTLYFYPILMQKMASLPPDIVTTYDSQALEFVNRITSFVKKTSVSSFLLIFDATKQNHSFLGHGYVLPSGGSESLSGLQSYPVIFSYPMETELSRQLHCAIVMLIGKMINNLKQEDKIEYLAEPNGKRTFFLSRIDFRVFMILVYEGKRDREKIIINFIENIKLDLNGKSIVNQLTLLGN